MHVNVSVVAALHVSNETEDIDSLSYLAFTNHRKTLRLLPPNYLSKNYSRPSRDCDLCFTIGFDY